MVAGEKGKIAMKNITLDDIIIGETISCKDEPLVFECDDFCDYDFPKMEKVPSGKYLALIEGCKKSFSRNKDVCFDIFYRLLSETDAARWCNDLTDTVPYYRIKQRTPLNSECAIEFKRSMRMNGLPPKFTSDDVIGVVERFTLEYKYDDSIGSITNRIKIDQDAVSYFEIEESSADTY